MNLESLIHLQYCYDTLTQIPLELLFYSHIPTALFALIFSIFVTFRNTSRDAYSLLIVSVAFAAWCFLDLNSWFSFMGASNTMFTWSLTDLVGLIFFYFSYRFLYTFIFEKEVPLYQTAIGFLLILPTAITTLLGLNLTAFDATYCEALENDSVTLATFIAQAVFITATIILTIVSQIKLKDHARRIKSLLVSLGVLTFLTFFFTATYVVTLLINHTSISNPYNYEIYGLFGMPILLVLLGYSIVKFRAFNVKIFGAQALILGIVAVIASQLFFVESRVNIILVSITLFFSILGGFFLIRSVKNEITLKERLAKANAGQERFIHFLSHEIKGFLTVGRNGYAAIAEGDYGPMPEPLTKMATVALERLNSGVTVVESILKSANLKSGKVQFKFAPFDICAAIRKRIDVAQPLLEERKLTLNAVLPDGDYIIVGDAEHLTDHVLKNLIENAIFYTPAGSIRVTLSRKTNSVVFSVKDTGVGITAEDKKRLFTEGGQGVNAVKVNAHSTGHGLFIAKSIVEAHGGRIWAESEGEGKGTTFFVELPVNPPQRK